MKPTAALVVLSCLICLIRLQPITATETDDVIKTSKDGWAITDSTNVDIFSFSPKSKSDTKTSASSKVKTVVSKNLESIKSEPSTNIRCIAEPADTKTSSDSNPVPAVKPTEKPKYAEAVAISGSKGDGATLSLLPLRLTLANIPEFAFLKRSPLSEASATTIAATEEQKSDKEKRYINIPENLFIPLDIGVGISLQPKVSKPSSNIKSLVSFQNTQSSEPKVSYSDNHLAKKQSFRPFSKFSGYPKYAEKDYEANNYAPTYSFHDRGSKSNNRPYHSQHKSFNPSESRFYQEKAKVMASEDNTGCRTVIKEIKDVPGRVKRGADEPRVIIMTKECYHPSDKAESVKIPDIKPGKYHRNYYHNRESPVRPSIRHYDSTQNVPKYTYHAHDFYHSPTKDDKYTYSDPYHHSGSAHNPHNHNYRIYPFSPSYYGQRRSSNRADNEEASSHYHTQPRSNRNEEHYHSENREKHPHHSSSDKVDHHHHHGKDHHDHDHHDHDHHHHDHSHHNHAKNAKPTPKTVTRSFAYYRKDKDNGKDPHNHEEGEEYAQGNYRSYSTSYDSDRDGPK